VNNQKGIQRPQDLKGKTVGLPEYQITAVVWLRGIFQDEYGVLPQDVRWRSGGEEEPGRKEKIELDLPPEIDLQPIPPDKYLSKMLDEGDLDALFTARTPSCYQNGSPNVARLFENPREEEERYFKKTGIFPIMHTIIMQREIYEKNSWIAVELYKAFCEAKKLVLGNYSRTEALHASLPWIHDELDRTEKIMGDDWWPYGMEKNRHILETFLRYHYEQGLSKKLMTIEELFAPETLDEAYKI
jgi:4,5-dihydroxyphthalate decarboxylase